ncbi:hypothetical protein [Moraxella caviae]|uniref:hypothetical protein n=1 Tax=Moraxella caviae TaxID=34060 RepID=UPI0010562DDB|nr:hypothetical protein [Moraxella caviae]
MIGRLNRQKAHEVLSSSATLLDRVGGANTFRHTKGGLDIYLLGVFDNKVSTIAHEAAHIAFDICHTVGIEVSTGRANETFCYLLDFLVGFADRVNHEHNHNTQTDC